MAGRRREQGGGRGDEPPRPPSPAAEEQRALKVRGLLPWMLLGAFSGGMPASLLRLAQGGWVSGIKIREWTGFLVPIWFGPAAVVACCLLVVVAGPFLARRRGRGRTGVLALLLPAAYAFALLYCLAEETRVLWFFLSGGLVVLDVLAVFLAPALFGEARGRLVRKAVLWGSAILLLALVSIPVLNFLLFVVIQ